MNAFRGTKLAAMFWTALAALLLAGCGSNDGGGPSNTVVKSVSLTGAQENPPVTTAAVGTGTLTFDRNTGAVSGTITTTGITATVAHIHEGPVGVNAPVIVPLTQTSPGVWTVPAGSTLTVPQIESLLAGNLYVNVHTAANPGGEIRAQIGRQVFFARLTGAQEVPAVTTSASGSGSFIFDPETRTLSGTVTTVGVAGTVAHVHTGAVGVAGPITIPMSGGPTWTLPATVLTEAQVADLLGGLMYANVHSAANPGGEIRGQIHLPVRVATLSGAQEVPPNSSTATGSGSLMINPVTGAVAGRLDWSGVNATDAHIHRAAAGVAGGIVIRGTVVTGNNGSLVINQATPLTEDLYAAFLLGNLYYNVHSAAFPPGEIRGQLVTGR